MKTRLIALLVGFCATTSGLLHGQNRDDKDPYNAKNFKSYYEIYGYKENLLRFLDIHPHDVVADVGAGDGMYEGALCYLYDSITVFAEDISPKILNEKKLRKQVRKYTALKKKPNTNTYHVVIGDTAHSKLPDGHFDKIIMLASYHEFSNVDTMIADLDRKLKPDGILYVIESFSVGNKIVRCEEGHAGYRIQQVEDAMKKKGYSLIRMKNPESNYINWANTLAFQKNFKLGRHFQRTRQRFEPYILPLTKVQVKTPMDSMLIRQLTDSLLPIKSDLDNIYFGFEFWVTDIARKHAANGDYRTALNLMLFCEALYPESYHCQYELAEVYNALSHFDAALVHYQKSLSIYPQSEACRKKITRLTH